MLVYFIRHGETDLNRQNIVQGSGMDTDLNDLGRAQAKAFFNAYQNVDFELIVTSKLRRTHQTVQHFLDQDIPWHQTEDINEISWGTHEGTSPNPERHQAFLKLLSEWKTGNLDAALPEGESARQLGERVVRFIDWLRQRPEKTVLVATHGRTLRAMMTHLKGVSLCDMEGVPHVNTGCYVVNLDAEKAVFDRENDVTHLESAQIMMI